MPERGVAGGAPARFTIRAIAQRAGTSVSTVSRVLNHRPDVSAEMRARVLDVIAEADYTVNDAARALTTRRTMMLGLLIGRLSSSYSGQLLRGVCGAAEEHGYNVVLYTMGDQPAQEERSIRALLHGQIDGLLLVLPGGMGSAIAQLRARQRPFVIIDHREAEPWGPSVGCTDRAGADEGTRYLLGLGHRAIAAITGPADWQVSQERLAGYRDALAEAGMELDDRLVREGSFGQRSGFTATRALLAAVPELTAIFAFNDTMAIGAMDALKDAGLRVPRHVSVLGFGDFPEAAATHPTLTTVRQPTLEIGRHAVGLLMRQINNVPGGHEPVDLPTSLVQRESCGLPPATAPHRVAAGAPGHL
jgi:LacI family transcriptional regulator